jgi:hypothetical protein
MIVTSSPLIYTPLLKLVLFIVICCPFEETKAYWECVKDFVSRKSVVESWISWEERVPCDFFFFLR